MQNISFRGQSGRAYKFQKMKSDGNWACEAGVALFAARGPFGWRVVRLSIMRGRMHDVQPIWAFADAQRYGASNVFVMPETDPLVRQFAITDLEAGLSPVCESQTELVSLAA